MAIEPTVGFTSLRLHESSFMVAVPEDHILASGMLFRWRRCATNILSRFHPYIPIGDFATRMSAGRLLANDYS